MPDDIDSEDLPIIFYIAVMLLRISLLGMITLLLMLELLTAEAVATGSTGAINGIEGPAEILTSATVVTLVYKEATVIVFSRVAASKIRFLRTLGTLMPVGTVTFATVIGAVTFGTTVDVTFDTINGVPIIGATARGIVCV